MWFRNRRNDYYVVDTSTLTHQGQIDACRAALRLIRPFVDRFQCDVPWANQSKWTNEVVQAASVLAPLPDGAPLKKTYKNAGWVTNFDEETWDAFVTFAPYAFSADAWDRDMSVVFDVSDEGDRLSLRISADQLGGFEESVAGAEVVPAAEWTRSRSEEWRLRINRRNRRTRADDGENTRR